MRLLFGNCSSRSLQLPAPWEVYNIPQQHSSVWFNQVTCFGNFDINTHVSSQGPGKNMPQSLLVAEEREIQADEVPKKSKD